VTSRTTLALTLTLTLALAQALALALALTLALTLTRTQVGTYWLLVELIILSAIFGFYCFFTIGDEDDTNGTFEGKEFAYAMTE
jgi:NAD/NADP transhydrogenase beta subunit